MHSAGIGEDSGQAVSSATVTRRVEWVDTDASGHQQNGIIMHLVESAETELIAAAGLLDAYFPSAPRVRHEIDFSGMLYFGQETSTTIVVNAIGRSSLTFGFEVWGEAWKGSPRRLAAAGKVVVAHVPQNANHSEPWPLSISRALIPYQ